MLKQFFKLKDYLQHALFAGAVMALASLVLTLIAVFGGNPIIWGAALVGIAVYFGREARDTEISNPPRFYDKLRVLLFWKWPSDQRKDFLAPLIGNVALALVAEVLPRVL